MQKKQLIVLLADISGYTQFMLETACAAVHGQMAINGLIESLIAQVDIPLVLQEAIDHKLFDEVRPISGAEGVRWARELAQKEGIFTGVSGGSTFGVARQVAESAPDGAVILCMLPDTGERYLTTPLFEGIEAEMSEDELALSRSTPSAQYAST